MFLRGNTCAEGREERKFFYPRLRVARGYAMDVELCRFLVEVIILSGARVN